MNAQAATEQKVLSFDDIEAAKDYVDRTVEVPEWRGAVVVRTLSMGGRYAIQTGSAVGEGKARKLDEQKFLALTLMHGLHSPKVDLVQAQAILGKSAQAVQRVVDAIWEVSALDLETAKNALPRA